MTDILQFLRRPVQRYCTECGRRMERYQGLVYGHDHDPRTGKPAWVWYWACRNGFFGFHRSYLDGRPFHSGWRIKTNAVRRRLDAR